MVKRAHFTVIALLFFSALTTYSGPGDGIHLGDGFVLTPSIEGSITHDDNIWRAPDDWTIPGRREVESDIFYALKLQLSLVRHSDAIRTRLDGWHRIQRYQDIDERDTDELGARFMVVTGSRENLRTGLSLRYAAVDHYDRGPIAHDLATDASEVEPLSDPTLQDRVSLGKRNVYEAGIDLGRNLTDKTLLDMRFRLHGVQYDDTEPFPSLLLKMNDRTTYTLAAEAGCRVTDKTTLFVTADGALHDSDAYDSDALRLGLRAGVATVSTDKLEFRGAIGVNRYEYEAFPDDVTRGQPGAFSPDRGRPQSRSDERMAGELGARWRPAERWLFRATAFTGYRPAVQYGGNATFDIAGQVNAGYRIARSHQLVLGGGLRREDYLEDVITARPDVDEGSQWIDKYVDLATVSMNYEYMPQNVPMIVNLGVRRNIATSNDLDAEYEVTLWTAGLALWY